MTERKPADRTTTIGLRRTAEMAAIFMIGDGMLGLLQPRRHVALWRSDATALDALVRPFGDHPGQRRAYGIVQLAAGLALAATLRAPGSAGSGRAHRPAAEA